MLLLCWHFKTQSRDIAGEVLLHVCVCVREGEHANCQTGIWRIVHYSKGLVLYNFGWCDMLLHVFRVPYIYMSMSIQYFFHSHMTEIKAVFNRQFSSTINLDVGAYNRDSCGEIDLIWRNWLYEIDICWHFCGEAIFILPGRTNNIIEGQEVSSAFFIKLFHHKVFQIHGEIHNKIASFFFFSLPCHSCGIVVWKCIC